jgi:hypothetical protein
MAYIGTKPTIGNFQICDAISVVNGQAAYTMQVGGVNVSPQSSNHMIVSLNGTIQKPNSSFTVSGSTITFASNLATGDVIDFIQILGDVLDLGVPSDATVSLAKLTATGTKDATTFLRGDNTFASAGLSNWSESSGNLLPSNASYGIYLGVNSATASNLLDDYEEGTWTPAVSGHTLTSVSNSTYTKIGNIVNVFARPGFSGGTNPGNTFNITGLPFTSSSTYRGSVNILVIDKDTSGSGFHQNIGEPTALVSNSSTTIEVDLQNSLTLNDVGVEDQIYIQITYPTDA